jgi:hypothetical protein
MQLCQAREQYFRWLLVTKDLSPHTIRAYETCTGMWSGNVEGWDGDERGGICGRERKKQRHRTVQRSVAGHRAGTAEPKDQGPTECDL